MAYYTDNFIKKLYAAGIKYPEGVYKMTTSEIVNFEGITVSARIRLLKMKEKKVKADFNKARNMAKCKGHQLKKGDIAVVNNGIEYGLFLAIVLHINEPHNSLVVIPLSKKINTKPEETKQLYDSKLKKVVYAKKINSNEQFKDSGARLALIDRITTVNNYKTNVACVIATIDNDTMERIEKSIPFLYMSD